jgi:hypothetical protein
MLVNNTQPNLKHMQTGEYSTLTLHPGYNEVDPETWAKLVKDNAVVRSWVEHGHVKPGDPKKSGKSLANLQTAEATAIIEETFSESMLREWAAEERRGGVLMAIQKQLDAIDPTKPKKEE